MDTYAVGVVGAGWMASDYHVPAYRAHPNARVAAVADVDAERRRAIADRVGVPDYPDAAAMLDAESLDAVSICTPPSTHESIFLDAVEAGCHVFCEKPLSTGAAAARRMADAAADAGVVTQVGYLHRYYENTKRAMRMIRNGLLGSLVEVRTQHHSTSPPQGWYYDRGVSGGGALRDLLGHTLDVYLDLFGAATVERCTTRHLRDRDVEDAASVALRFEGERVGGAPVDVSVSWSQPEGFWRTTVVGTEGWVAYGPETLEGEIGGRALSFRRGEHALVDVGLASLYGAEADDAGTERLRDFVDHVVAGDPATSAPASRGAAVAAAVDAGYELAGEGA